MIQAQVVVDSAILTMIVRTQAFQGPYGVIKRRIVIVQYAQTARQAAVHLERYVRILNVWSVVRILIAVRQSLIVIFSFKRTLVKFVFRIAIVRLRQPQDAAVVTPAPNVQLIVIALISLGRTSVGALDVCNVLRILTAQVPLHIV